MECFHISEQRLPHICLYKVPIASVQHFILSTPDYRHINFQRFPHFFIIISIFQCSKCSSSGATEYTKECHGHFDWLHPKNLSIKNRYYDRKVRESLKIDMGVVRYGQDKKLSRYNGNFVKTNAWKPLLRKMKALHWNLTSFCINLTVLRCTLISL